MRRGITVKALNVGSTGGLAAAKRGECDIAGDPLMDPQTGEYNRPFLTDALDLVPGYGRLQGIVFRRGDSALRGPNGRGDRAPLAPACLMVNRNAGSGTRILIDRLLGGTGRPATVAAEIAQRRRRRGGAGPGRLGRRDRHRGAAIRARLHPAQDEHYDFVVPRARLDRPAVQHFLAVLADRAVRAELSALGFRL